MADTCKALHIWQQSGNGFATVATDPSEISNKYLHMLKRLCGTKQDQTLSFCTVCMMVFLIT